MQMQLKCTQLCSCEGLCAATSSTLTEELVEDEHEVDNEINISFDSDDTESADEIDVLYFERDSQEEEDF